MLITFADLNLNKQVFTLSHQGLNCLPYLLVSKTEQVGQLVEQRVKASLS